MNNVELFNWIYERLPKKGIATIQGDGTIFEGGKASQADKPSPHSSHTIDVLWKRARKAFPEDLYLVYGVANTNSMEPLFDDNCQCIMEKITDDVLRLQPLVAGDIVIYSAGSTLIIHRLLSTKVINNETYWLVGGDNNFFPDGWVKTDRIQSRLVGILYGRVQRQGD